MASRSGKTSLFSGAFSSFKENKLQFALIAPMVIWFTLFLVIPLLLIFYYSFLTVENFQIVQQVSLETWTTNVFTATNANIFAITFLFGLLVTGLTILFGYPVAYYLRFHVRPNIAFMVVLISIIPFWISGIIRALAWYPILQRGGIVNQLLLNVGLVQEPLSWLLFSRFAMAVGFLANYVVFMYVPIYASLLNVDEDLTDASETLRGSPWATFRNVTLPLSLPGVVIGTIFVFVLTLGDFVIPQFLSGGQTTVPGLVYLKVNQGLNYPTAAALSIVLLVIILFVVGLLTRRIDITESF
jgi:ABC-type spermidine/putrescine transport system permease subunit I